MLSIYTIKSVAIAKEYYQHDNYYAKSGEPIQDRWFGVGAELLGKTGTVTLSEFVAALEGKLSNDIVMQKTTENHRPGYDLTFSAPKSVSILAIVARDKQVLNAHRNAVNAVLTYIENNYAATRVKNQNKVHIELTNNLLVSKFEHTDSRSLDPNLHTHCVVMNATKRSDGEWRTLFADPLYDDKLLLGVVYRSKLANELMKAGYEIVQTSNQGFFELKNFPENLIKQFSKRRNQIEETLKDMNQSGGKAAQLANLITRSEKKNVQPEFLELAWTIELQSAGSSLEWLQNYTKAAKERGPIALPDPYKLAHFAVNSAARNLEVQGAFTIEKLIKLATALSVRNYSDEALKVALQEQFNNGTLLYLRNNLCTTQTARNLEISNIANMRLNKNQVIPFSSKFTAKHLANQFFDALQENYKSAFIGILTNTDRQMGVFLETIDDYIALMQPFVKLVYKHSCYPIGLTQTADRVKSLQSELGLERVQTIEGFLLSCDKRALKIKNQPIPAYKFKTAKQMWILDFNNNITAQSINKLQMYANQFGARIIWSDAVHKKYTSLKQLMNYNMNHYVVQNNAIKAQFTTIETKELSEQINQAAQKYLSLPSNTTLLATNNYTKKLLNDQVRLIKQQLNELSGTNILCTTLQPRFLTEQQKSKPHYYQLNDVLLITGDCPLLSLPINSYLTITNIKVEDRKLLVKNSSDNEFSLQLSENTTWQVFRQENRNLQINEVIIWNLTIRNVDNRSLDRISYEPAKVIEFNKGLIVVQLTNGNKILLNPQALSDQHFEYGYAKVLSNNTIKSEHNILVLSKQNKSKALNNFLNDPKGQTYIFSGSPIKQQQSENNLALSQGVKYYPITNISDQDPSRERTKAELKWVEAKYCERHAIFGLKNFKLDLNSINVALPTEIVNQELNKALDKKQLIAVHGTGEITDRENVYLGTTDATQKLENLCIKLVLDEKNKVKPIVENYDYKNLPNQLTDGQKQALTLLLGTRDRFVAIQGIAGSGKTTMLCALNTICKNFNYEVIGITQTASARGLLKQQGIESFTVSRFLLNSDRLLAKNHDLAIKKYGGKKLYILDEASFVSTETMVKLVNRIRELQVRSGIIGDNKQLPSIDAGKIFYLLLGSNMESVAVTHNVRFSEPKALITMQYIYKNQIAEALQNLGNNLIEIPDHQERINTMAQLYLQKNDPNVLLITPNHADRMLVNDAVRQGLKKSNVLTGVEIYCDNLQPINLTNAEQQKIFYFKEQDWICFNQDSSQLNVKKGEYYQVVVKDFVDQSLTLERADGLKIIWSPGIVKSLFNIYRQGTRGLMLGDQIRWLKNYDEKNICNGETAKVLNIEQATNLENINQPIFVTLQLQNGEQLTLNFRNKAHKHWDHAYAATAFVAQGLSRTTTIGLVQGGYSKDLIAKDLKPNDVIMYKKEDPKDTINQATNQVAIKSQWVRIISINNNNITAEDRLGNNLQLDLNCSPTELYTNRGEAIWHVYPDPKLRRLTDLPPLTSLEEFLVTVTRGDNVILLVDHIEAYQHTLQQKLDPKRSALEFLSDEHKEVKEKVFKMTENITGKAIDTVNDVVKTKSINIENTVSDKQSLYNKNDNNCAAQIMNVLHNNVSHYARNWLGTPSKITGSELRWGKKGSLVIKTTGAQSGYWHDFETSAGGKNLILLYCHEFGVSYQDAVLKLAEELYIKPKSDLFKTQDLLQQAQQRLEKKLQQSEKVSQEQYLLQAKKINYAREVYAQGVPINGTLAEKYLREFRGITGGIPNDFRFCAKLKHPDLNRQVPALLAPIKNGQGEINGIVRIFLNNDGSKLKANYIDNAAQEQLATVKANLGSVVNSAVTINQAKFPGTAYIAEGIETALSIAQVESLSAVYAALSVSNLKNVPLSLDTQKVILCADNDGVNAASNKALLNAAKSYLERGLQVAIAYPENINGMKKVDFNDVLKKLGVQSIERSLQQAVPQTLSKIINSAVVDQHNLQQQPKSTRKIDSGSKEISL